MKPAIRVENLTKQYRLGGRSAGGYRTLRETIVDSLAAPFRRLGGAADRNGPKVFDALKDVGFTIYPGEVVGIIGRNGAGKSTLLKVLSRITEPTGGRAELRGRLGSLLEVGTGFHPELTGRENVYLSGTILGMTRQEIAKKFDEIVAFSEIEQFLDTPVKRYSSGMYVRLAFAVAAHLEPEILVVDEVLAVGDVGFQKKCLQRMQDAGREGRTILFVSHNLSALQTLCRRGILLERGRLLQDGPVGDAVARYLRSLEVMSETDLAQRTDRRGAGLIRYRGVKIVGEGGGEPGQLVMGRPARFIFELDRARPDAVCAFAVLDAHGGVVTRFNSGLSNLEDGPGQAGEPVASCVVEEMLLAPGRYRIDVTLRAAGEVQDRVEAAAFFDVVRGPVRGREPPRAAGEWVVCLPHRWENIG
jgi:lipopolysaccharide transport system ATP-binding protein